VEEIDNTDRTTQFVDNDVPPVLGGYWERHEVSYPLPGEMASFGLIGDGMDSHGMPR
jgi:hypothetical protein